MPVNQNWNRWIFASISQHFVDGVGSELPLYIEAQLRGDMVRTTPDFAELRVDGPYVTEVSKNYWRHYLEVNVLIRTSIGSNYHQIHTYTGLICSIFTDISLYKYGNTINDDDSIFGCLGLLQDSRGRDRIQVSHYGQIEPDLREVQATVEGHYEVFLEN